MRVVLLAGRAGIPRPEALSVGKNELTLILLDEMSASRESRLAQHPEDIMIRSLRNLIGRRSVPVTRRRPSARPGFDALEDRTAPAILFHPGVSVTLSNHNDGQAAGPVLQNPLVELVFWGNGWNTNQTLQTNVTNAVTYLIRSGLNANP